MKWLKRIAIALAVLLLLLAGTLWWLLDTASGLRFALDQASSFTHGALSVRQAQGHLLGPLDLAGVRYADGQGLDARIAKAHLAFRFWPLLRKRAHVLVLEADGIEVDLPKSQPDQASSSGGFSLQPPIAVVLDRVHVGKLAIRQDGKPLFASDRLDLAGSWTDAGIAVKQLALRAPDGQADLAGQLAVGKRYRGDGTAAFAWAAAGNTYAGRLEAHSDGAKARLDLHLNRPLAAQLRLDLVQSGDFAWQARLEAPRFDPKPLLGDGALKALSVALEGKGDRYRGVLNGTLGLNDYQLLLKPLDARFSGDYKLLTLNRLALASPQVPGALQARGTVQLGAQPVAAELAVDWQGLKLPAELAGQELASAGKLAAKGSAERFHAEGDVDVGPPGKLAKLALNLDGTPQEIDLHTLALKQPQGGLTTTGKLILKPELAWQLDMQARRLDPGQLFAGWDGALDFALATEGKLAKQGPDATLDLQRLAGSLRQRKLAGSGKLHLSPARVIDGTLALNSGGSSIKLAGKPGASNDLALDLAIASLGDWLPDAAGSLAGNFSVRGLEPKLAVNGRLQGRALAYQGQKLDSLQLAADIPDLSNPGGKLDLEAAGASAGGLAFQRIALRGDGTAASHRLSLQALGKPLSAELALTGALKGKAWNGSLGTLNLDLQGLPRWRLQNPAQLAYADGAMSLSELCLTAGEPLLCASAKQDQGGNLDASYRLRALPLALLVSAAGNANLPVRADGTLEGDGNVHRTAAGALSGKATLGSAKGTITYVEHPDQPLLSYRDFTIDANLDPAGQRATVRAGLNDGGSLDGQVAISGAQQNLGGQLALKLNNLAFVELFTQEVANLKGRLGADFKLGGNLGQPAVDGQAVLEGFAAEVPAAGLKLSDGRIVVATRDARQFRIDGSLHSGKGQLAITGNAGLGENAQTAIAIKGSQFTAADIPAAKVVISPDLTIDQNAQGIAVGGSVLLDSADVDVSKLPGGGATQASPDVVVVDEKQAEAAKGLPITASVKVDLGSKTHLTGMGLDGRLGGQLVVSERPGRDTTGQGQISVDGIYKAYGQNLHIQRGQLLFASTPVDNPGLDIKAVRKLNPNATIDEGQEVGLYVSGTAKRPVLTVFSNPVMEQSDALSYLVTGKPLSQVKGGEGDMVGAAAQALGSAAGDLLAKSIGSKIGVDEIGVSSNDALNGGSAFTVGKYLSPRLFMSYGIGLFDPGQVITLRYKLSSRWNFEALNATDFNRASLNYRLEK